MHTKKLMTLLLAVVLVLSLAACGAKGGDHMDGMDNEPKTAEEAAAMHKELTAQEAAILAENTALWEKVFMAADKGKIMMEDGKNYAMPIRPTPNSLARISLAPARFIFSFPQTIHEIFCLLRYSKYSFVTCSLVIIR